MFDIKTLIVLFSAVRKHDGFSFLSREIGRGAVRVPIAYHNTTAVCNRHGNTGEGSGVTCWIECSLC